MNRSRSDLEYLVATGREVTGEHVEAALALLDAYETRLRRRLSSWTDKDEADELLRIVEECKPR